MSDSVVTDESGVDENVDSTDSQPQTEVNTKSAEQVLIDCNFFILNTQTREGGL